jgi:hypothetical protein
MADLLNTEKVILPSGAELSMTLAPFVEGNRLFTAVAQCAKNVDIDAQKDVVDIAGNINALKDAFLNCLTSKEVSEAILLCLRRCVYNGQKINDWSFFDDAKLRADYLPVCWEVAKFNLLPFTNSLFSRLSGVLAAQKSESQKQK